jgi:hypothetical protein
MAMDGTDNLDAASDFPSSLPESDRLQWAGMTASQRGRAADRLAAIESWQSGAIPLEAALQASGLSRTRFYTVAAEFRSAGTLASLGAFAGAGASRQRLDPEAVNALQAVVADVVALNRGASTSQLVRLMVEASGVEERLLPGSTRLRAIVEAEQRRADATGQAGNALKLDVSAINLPRADGRPHLMHVIADDGTRLVLGLAVGATLDEADGYARAARDAQARIEGALAGVRWVDRLLRMEITVGGDQVRAAALRTRLIDGGVKANVQLAPVRYGRYWRKLVGPRIGRVEITPGRTEEGRAVPDNDDMTPWTDEAALAAVTLAVEQHNAAILAELDVSHGRPVMPDDMRLALDVLSEAGR